MRKVELGQKLGIEQRGRQEIHDLDGTLAARDEQHQGSKQRVPERIEAGPRQNDENHHQGQGLDTERIELVRMAAQEGLEMVAKRQPDIRFAVKLLTTLRQQVVPDMRMTQGYPSIAIRLTLGLPRIRQCHLRDFQF